MTCTDCTCESDIDPGQCVASAVIGPDDDTFEIYVEPMDEAPADQHKGWNPPHGRFYVNDTRVDLDTYLAALRTASLDSGEDA